MWQIWLIIAILFFILEMMGPGFLLFWFGVGALITTIVSIFVDNVIIQIGVFAISSTLLLFCTKPFVKKVTKNETVLTNVYSIIGKNGIVTKEINTLKGSGQIKINEELWSAKSSTNDIIPEGTTVTVLQIDGVKALVKKA